MSKIFSLNRQNRTNFDHFFRISFKIVSISPTSKFRKRLLNDSLLLALRRDRQDRRKSMEITRPEFILWNLAQAHLVDPQFVAAISTEFDRLDKSQNGKLNMEDVRLAEIEDAHMEEHGSPEEKHRRQSLVPLEKTNIFFEQMDDFATVGSKIVHLFQHLFQNRPFVSKFSMTFKFSNFEFEIKIFCIRFRLPEVTKVALTPSKTLAVLLKTN